VDARKPSEDVSHRGRESRQLAADVVAICDARRHDQQRTARVGVEVGDAQARRAGGDE